MCTSRGSNLHPLIATRIRYPLHHRGCSKLNNAIIGVNRVIVNCFVFQDKSVIQSIPTYFQNSEPPIICYKYNKPIRNTIFNFNKLVSDLDIHANTPKS